MGHKKYNKELTFCFQERTDCFAFQDGGCGVLRQTYGVDEKPCPFYRKKPKNEETKK